MYKLNPPQCPTLTAALTYNSGLAFFCFFFVLIQYKIIEETPGIVYRTLKLEFPRRC